MKLTELKAGVIRILKTKYPAKKYKYYGMDVVEQYTRPCFFIQLVPVKMEPENYNSQFNQINMHITIMQKSIDEAEMLDMIQTIHELFGLHIQIGDRAIKVTSFDWEYAGTERNIPEISITLEWIDKIEHVNSAPLMKKVHIKRELEG